MLKVDDVLSIRPLKAYQGYIQTVTPLLEKMLGMLEESKEYKLQRSAKYCIHFCQRFFTKNYSHDLDGATVV